MQAVGQLVGLGADEAGLGLVDRPVELLGAHAAQLLREELLHRGVDGLDEAPGAAHQIFIEAGLALVHAHGDAACQAGILQVVPDAQLIQGMAALVQDRVHGGRHIAGVVVRGNADVLVVEFQRERMLRLAQAAVAPVQPHDLHQIIRKGFLLVHRIIVVQEAVVDLGLPGNLLQQRHNGLAQSGKKFVQHFGIHAPLVLVQEGIIGGSGAVVIGGKFAVILYQLLQQGAEHCKVIFFFCLVPDISRFVHQLTVGDILFGRDAGQLVTAAAQLLHLAAVEKIQLVLLAIQLIQQGSGLGADHQLLLLACQHAQRHAPAL